jgi:hypothetical protein
MQQVFLSRNAWNKNNQDVGRGGGGGGGLGGCPRTYLFLISIMAAM